MSDQTTRPHSYAIKYLIVDQFGAILWQGTATIHQNVPRPEGEVEATTFDAMHTVQIIRDSCPPNAPAGRVIVLAAMPV